ncbi:MAG TPA: RNA methyltransferase [Mariprofundaceae bacterium]|nr:RNA methyltransferase [Mariprofundaceae bacterium]
MAEPRIAVALVHHPVLNRLGETSTTAITSMDVHDFARSCTFYDVAPVFLVHPADGMHAFVDEMRGYWQEGEGGGRNPGRGRSLASVQLVHTLDEAVAAMDGGSVWFTSSSPPERETTDVEALGEMPGRHLIVFGTGWGLDVKSLQKPTGWLSPIEGTGMVRHLSVRAALAIYLDRLRR